MRFKIRKIFSRLLPKGSTAHSVSIIAGGTATAQFLNIVTMPIFSRVYSPSDFGILALYVSITGILVEISGLRYHLAIPLVKKQSFSNNLVLLSLFLQCAFIVSLLICLFLFKNFFLDLISANLLVPYWFLIPVGIGGMGFYLTMTQWAIRESEFSLIAKTRLTQSFWGILVKFVLGMMGVCPAGLLLGTVASYVGGVFTLIKKFLTKHGIPRLDRVQLKRLAIKYRKFPLFSTWAGMLNTLGRQITPILLVSFYGTQTAGLFAFGMQVLQLPAVVIGQAIGQVFVQRASVAKYEGTLADVSLKTLESLLQIGIFPILCLCLLAPDLFSFGFGNNWYDAGLFSRVLGPWVVLGFAYSPLSNLFSILEKQAISLVFESIYLFVRIVSVYLGYLFGSDLISISLFGGVGFCFLLFAIFLLLILSNNSFLEVMFVFLRSTKNNFFLLLPIILCLYFNFHFIITFIISCFMGVIYIFFLNGLLGKG